MLAHLMAWMYNHVGPLDGDVFVCSLDGLGVGALGYNTIFKTLEAI